MQILITGATGYLGSFLCQSLLAKGEHNLLSVSRSKHKLFEESDSFQQRIIDLAHLDLLTKDIEDFAPEVIIHLAALSSPHRCEEHPGLAKESHIELTGYISAIAKKLGAYCIFSSSDWVYGAEVAPEGGYTENMTPKPNSVYGELKCEAERLIENAEGAVLRNSLIYGPEIGEKRGSLSWMEDGLKGLMSIELFEDEWRTPVFVEDVIACINSLLEKKLSGVFHCAGPQRINRVDFGRLYAKSFGFPSALIKPVRRCESDQASFRPEDISLCSLKAKEALEVDFQSPQGAFALLLERKKSANLR